MWGRSWALGRTHWSAACSPFSAAFCQLELCLLHIHMFMQTCFMNSACQVTPSLPIPIKCTYVSRWRESDFLGLCPRFVYFHNFLYSLPPTPPPISFVKARKEANLSYARIVSGTREINQYHFTETICKYSSTFLTLITWLPIWPLCKYSVAEMILL